MPTVSGSAYDKSFQQQLPAHLRWLGWFADRSHITTAGRGGPAVISTQLLPIAARSDHAGQTADQGGQRDA